MVFQEYPIIDRVGAIALSIKLSNLFFSLNVPLSIYLYILFLPIFFLFTKSIGIRSNEMVVATTSGGGASVYGPQRLFSSGRFWEP